MGSPHRRNEASQPKERGLPAEGYGVSPPATGDGTGPAGGGRDGGGEGGCAAPAPTTEVARGGVVIVMGVAGTGKTTVGALLAEALGVPYAEADSFHPPANVAKMSAGEPLDDTDREPWLDAIGAWAARRAGLGGVVSCSALKRAYRDRLRAAAPGVFFVHLTGDRSLIARRMEQRTEHFMPLTLLDSQFATLEPLEPDEEGAAVPVGVAPDAVTRRALAALRERPAKEVAPAGAAPAEAEGPREERSEAPEGPAEKRGKAPEGPAPVRP